ncbi:MAG: O-antigen ligase family protein, partial [Terriglobia bacterium]
AWRAGWEMFKDHPLTGVGSMQFPNANGAKYWPNQRNPVWLNAHSLYFQVLGELGLLGTLIFLLFVVNLLRTNKRLGHILSGDGSTARWLQAFPLACTLSLVVLLFAGYSSHNLYRSTWYLLAGLSASLYAMASRKLSPEERSLDHAASPSREWLLAPGVES